jgi:hypothetical protein
LVVRKYFNQPTNKKGNMKTNTTQVRNRDSNQARVLEKKGLVARCQCGDLTEVLCKAWDNPEHMVAFIYRPRWAQLPGTWSKITVSPECQANVLDILYRMECSRD